MFTVIYDTDHKSNNSDDNRHYKDRNSHCNNREIKKQNH